MTENVRVATTADCDAVTLLNQELGYRATDAEMRQRLNMVLADPAQTVFIAEADGQIVGWLHVAAVASLESDRFAEIRGLVVRSGFRSRGIGAGLVRAAEEWAGSAGLRRMRVRSNISRERARVFYEREGYRVTKTQNVFDKELTNSRE